jgi:IucA / IucC family/Ferric iron reductase FhuF-like transporter
VRAGRRAPDRERELVLRMLTTFLREDVAGLRTRGRLIGVPGERWLALNRLRVPVRAGAPACGDLVTDLAARQPLVILTRPGRRAGAYRLHAVLNALAGELVRGLDPLLAAEFTAGFGALRDEACAALTGAAIRRRRRPSVFGRLRRQPQAGWSGAIGFETLAAHRDHPLYPFSIARVGLTAAQLPRFAPEHHPLLRLDWVVVPGTTVERRGWLPDWWPVAGGDDLALPVHPAIRAADLGQPIAEQFGTLAVHPTLSLRTVVPARSPQLHLKLPLPIRTLGRLNLRVVARAGLADGALLSVLLRRIVEAEPRFADRVVVADETSWLHAGHPLLAVLIRRWDTDLSAARIVPVAALAAIGPDGKPVISVLAEQLWDGDLDALIATYLRAVIDWQVNLWLRHGIVLEAHPQNVLIAVDRPPAGPRLRLLLRDLDSARIDLAQAGDSLGALAPTRAELADPRMAGRDPGELADLFITTTLHQCVAGVLVDVATALSRPVRPLLRQIRPLLTEAAVRHADSRDAALLTGRIISAARLPVKRALTAATLLPKTRTGAADVNKYYGADAPSYL